jgi:hypothetical protein
LPPIPIAACGVCMNHCRAADSIMPFILKMHRRPVDSGSPPLERKSPEFASGCAERNTGAKLEGGPSAASTTRTLAQCIHSSPRSENTMGSSSTNRAI